MPFIEEAYHSELTLSRWQPAREKEAMNNGTRILNSFIPFPRENILPRSIYGGQSQKSMQSDGLNNATVLLDFVLEEPVGKAYNTANDIEVGSIRSLKTR